MEINTTETRKVWWWRWPIVGQFMRLLTGPGRAGRAAVCCRYRITGGDISRCDAFFEFMLSNSPPSAQLKWSPSPPPPPFPLHPTSGTLQINDHRNALTLGVFLSVYKYGSVFFILLFHFARLLPSNTSFKYSSIVHSIHTYINMHYCLGFCGLGVGNLVCNCIDILHLHRVFVSLCFVCTSVCVLFVGFGLKNTMLELRADCGLWRGTEQISLCFGLVTGCWLGVCACACIPMSMNMCKYYECSRDDWINWFAPDICSPIIDRNNTEEKQAWSLSLWLNWLWTKYGMDCKHFKNT